MALTDKKCVPCQGGEPTLKKGEIKKYLSELDGDWKVEDPPAGGSNKLVKEFEFKDFSAAITFVNKVADLAEEEGHHPNIYIHSYKKVRIELWTHKIGGLHENDFIMAAKIEHFMNKHYICTGGCKGVSDKPGVCQTEGCPKHKHQLKECDCTDGKHYGAFDDKKK